MQTVHRRAFMGTIAAGLPLLVAQDVAGAQRGRGANRGAQVEAELFRQFRDGIRGMRGQRRGEAMRSAAGNLRALAAHFRESGIDDQYKAHVRDLVARRRDVEVLSRDTRATLLASMREFGVTTIGPQADYDTRQRALRRIQSEGVTPTLERCAELFERISDDIDRRPVVLIRQEIDCSEFAFPEAIVHVIAAMGCLFNPVTCAVFGGLAAGLRLSLAYYGC